MAVVMTVHGRPVLPFNSVIGRVANEADGVLPGDTALICHDSLPEGDLSAFAALLVTPEVAIDFAPHPRIVVCENLGHLFPGDLVLVNGESGHIRTVYRRASTHNALFVTEQCNSNCLMCSQPPKQNDVPGMFEVCRRIVELLRDDPPAQIGITGGEPTLHADRFLRLLSSLKASLPSTSVVALTNGRCLSDAALCAAIAQIGHPAFRFSVPLHADVPDVHDYISQSKGAFYQTVNGLYNLAECGLDVEVRVVLHALSVPRLLPTAEWIWRKVPFVQQVAFMGLETLGYVRKNWSHLWIDPADYAGTLRTAIEHLYRRGMNVSIYNLPLCLLPPEIWGFARQSISDHKRMLVDECSGCGLTQHCSGFFQSAETRHSNRIQPIRIDHMQSRPLRGDDVLGT